MINIQNLVLEFGSQTIFDSISFSLLNSEKAGLVGRNGSGKSTLLKVISGLIAPDSGTINKQKGLTIAYLPQEIVLSSTKSVFDETYTVFDHYTAMLARKEFLEAALANQPNDAHAMTEEYLTILEQVSSFSEHDAIERTRAILTGLGFNAAMLKQSVDTLSLGWKMRIVLAKLLLQQADFYLFDEPTNHLDIVTKEWFFNFLKHASFGYLLISHDRYFLEHACEKIIELERGNATVYYGNFSYYLAQKEEQRAVLLASYKRQQRDISQKKATIDRFRAGTKAKMAQSMLKKLEKMELIEIEPTLPQLSFSFPPIERSTSSVLSLENLSYHFGNKTLFAHLSGEILRGQKIGLVAANGKGKTTLLRLITGKLALQEGSMSLGERVSWAYFEQDQALALNPQATIMQEIQDACPQVPDLMIRRFLGTFLFSGDAINKKIGVLSGGEKNRVAMVRVLLQKANFLILDEPTNHLDIYSQDALLQALKQYEGTILFVSHDRNFIEGLATTIWELTENGLHIFPGSYEQFLYIQQRQQPSSVSAGNSPTPTMLGGNEKAAKKEHPDKSKIDKELKKIEATTEKLTKEKRKIEESFAALDYGTNEYQKAVNELEKISKELTKIEEQWHQLAISLDE